MDSFMFQYFDVLLAGVMVVFLVAWVSAIRIVMRRTPIHKRELGRATNSDAIYRISGTLSFPAAKNSYADKLIGNKWNDIQYRRRAKLDLLNNYSESEIFENAVYSN